MVCSLFRSLVTDLVCDGSRFNETKDHSNSLTVSDFSNGSTYFSVSVRYFIHRSLVRFSFWFFTHVQDHGTIIMILV